MDITDITPSIVTQRNLIKRCYPNNEAQDFKRGLAEKPFVEVGGRLIVMHGGCSHGPPDTHCIEYDPENNDLYAVLRDGSRLPVASSYQRADYFRMDAECVIGMGTVNQFRIEVALCFSGDPYRSRRTYAFGIPQFIEGREKQFRPRVYDVGDGAHAFTGASVQEGDSVLAAVQLKSLGRWPNLSLSTDGKRWFECMNAGRFPDGQQVTLATFKGEIFGVCGVIGEAPQVAPTVFRLDPQRDLDGTYMGVMATPVADKDRDYWPEGQSWTRGGRVEWPEVIAGYETDDALILHTTGRGGSRLMRVENPSVDRPTLISQPGNDPHYFVRGGKLCAACTDGVYEYAGGEWQQVASYALPDFVRAIKGAYCMDTGLLVLAVRQLHGDSAIVRLTLPSLTDDA